MSTQIPADRSDETRDDGIGDASAEVSPADATEEAESGVDRTQAILAALDQRGRSGANWFYWVAALSLVNSAMLLGGVERHFVIGLAVTQIVDTVGIGIAQQAPEQTRLIYAVTFVMNLMFALFVSGFGWLSKRRWLSVFLIGMGLYLLDGLLFVLFSDWMSAAFHAYALYGMWRGWSAFREMTAVEESQGWSAAPPASDELAPAVE